MPRPTVAQICTGTLTVVVATVALLSVSGVTGALEIAVVVAVALALGTLATALSMAGRRRPAAPRPVAVPPVVPAGPGVRTSASREYARQG
ncbi:hypothetical protein OG689_25970 [Kitasatospora sp. NBC_00240]|uniref:hypothetical protein n=1 Tax=Kitasatospora sp. NBC_00240 TaxID=2903567 RepID=UPI0022576ABF|nr:hypothetical protein [Kitasatospora sp. NBC_00240]MCX5212689.1 hypothetical protein [Kitasatospora sp. NBC_00240]